MVAVLEQALAELDRRGEGAVRVALRRTPDGAHADVDSDAAVGYITVWDRGFCDMEVVDAVTEQQRYYEHIEFDDSSAAEIPLDKFLAAMVGA